MQLLRATDELRPGDRKVCLAVGFFDGVHLGHQQIIRQTIADAHQHDGISLVLTFDQHPNAVVAPDRVPPLIYSLAQKLRAIESLGNDAILLLRFDRAFSEQTGEAFIRQLAHDLGFIGARHSGRQRVPTSKGAAGRNSALQSVCVGADFVFGHKRSGNVALLKQLGTELNFTVHGIAAVSLDGQVVSSTRIRETIRAGDLDAASQMLGRAYSLAARVVKGEQLGTKLGFPTANLDVSGLVLPPNGVYAAHVLVQGKTHRAVLNIGCRPTVQRPAPGIRLEVHLLDFCGELYGEEMEVIFVEKLRDEQRFSSLSALSKQIAQDVARAQARF